MKKEPKGDKLVETFGVLLSVALIIAVCLGSSAEKISLAMASMLFYSGNSVQTETAAVSPSAPSSPPRTTAPSRASSEPDGIAQTPTDVKEIMKKYAKLLAGDERGGGIRSVSYRERGATDIFENVRVKNTTDTKSLDVEKVLSEPLGLSIDKSKPAVLIFHSHTSESYETIERDWYAKGDSSRSYDENLNVVRVGTEISNYLNKLGYTVIHDKTIHDKNYKGSYPHSRETVKRILKENPEISIALDIHRDSISLENGDKVKPTFSAGGKKAAQIMIVTGAEEGKVENFPDWEYNLRFALRLQQKCETMFPGFTRPALFSQRKYNMDLTRFSLLIEVGGEANTLEEACYSGRMLASALASLMDEYARKGGEE